MIFDLDLEGKAGFVSRQMGWEAFKIDRLRCLTQWLKLPFGIPSYLNAWFKF